MCLVLNFTKEQEKELNKYAENNNLSLKECAKRIILEKLEDAEDLKIGLKALEDYKNNPITYSHEEVFKMIGL